MSSSLTATSLGSAPSDRLDTLPSWPWGPNDRDAPRTLGWHAYSWSMGLEWDWKRAGWRRTWPGLVQPNGPRSGQQFRPTTRQLRFLLWFYAVDDQGGWLFNHAVRRLAKGSGKSPSAALLALTEFLGPVRLEQFDDRAPGGTVGRTVDMPWVQIAATAESQTKNTMRMVRAFAPKKSPIVERYGIDWGKTQFSKLPEGTLEVITASATAAEGAESTCVIGDETEHWKESNGGVDLAATIEDNLAKSGARMVETCNAFVPGDGSVAESSWDAWLLQEEGRARGEQRILYDAVIAPPDTDMSDPESLRAALEWVYEDCDWKKPHRAGDPVVDAPPDVRPIMERIWSPRSRPDDSRRKYLNQPTAAADAWVTFQEWSRLADKSKQVGPDDPVVLFFDGSKSRDATALVGCRLDDGHVFTVAVWEPDPAHDTVDTVSAAEVDMVVQQTFDAFDVVAFFADVREWEQFALTTWPQRYGDQLKVWAAPQGRPPQPVAWDMRGHAYEFAKATEACHAEIVEGAFTHDGHAAVARHVANARRRPYRDSVAVRKESPSSPKKIDAAVCVIGARMVRRMVLGSKKYRPKTGRALFAG